MKKIKFLNGMSAVFALAVVALATTFTSCEKEEFNVDVTPVNAKAVINPIVLAVQSTGTIDVTSQATITPAELSFTGNPTLAASTVEVTATYDGMSSTVSVKVPALEAGQFASLTPTIILQGDDVEVKIVVEDPEELGTRNTEPKVFKTWDNYDLFWYYLPSFPYQDKTGNEVLEGTKEINTTDLIELGAINSFFAGLNTCKEVTKMSEANKYKVLANSRSTAYTKYEIKKLKYTIVKKAVTKADTAPLASIEVDFYTTILDVEDNQDIPGHGHSHGHGHGHGGDYNAGGGVVEID